MKTDRWIHSAPYLGAIACLLLLGTPSLSAQPPGGPEGVPPGPDPVRTLERLDQDGDGLVQASEFDGPAEHFARLDRDGDGALSSRELPAGPPPRQAGPTWRPLLHTFDADGDGRLSVTEVEGAFASADLDRDGYLSDEELGSEPGPRGPGPRGRGRGEAP